MKKIKNLDLFIIVFFSILFKYWSIWGLYADSIKYIFLGISTIFAVISLMNKKYSIKELYRILILFFISCIMCYSTGEIDFIYACLLATVFMRKEKGDYLFVKYYFISDIVLFIITILFGKLGITVSNNTVRLVNGVLTSRDSLGFEHVNAVFKNFFPICLAGYMLFYYKSKKTKKVFFIIMIIISFILFLATNCRTGFLATLLLLPLSVIFDKIKVKHKFEWVKYFFLIYTLISFVIAYKFGPTSKSLNTLLSNRPILYYNMITTSKISLFGDINKGIVDNMYLWLLYHHGLIAYIIYFIVYFLSVKKIIRNKIFVLPLFLFYMYAMLENLDVYSYNFLLIIQLMVLIKDNSVNYLWISNEETKVNLEA